MNEKDWEDMLSQLSPEALTRLATAVENTRRKLQQVPPLPAPQAVGKHAYSPIEDGLTCTVCTKGRYHLNHRDELGNKL